jgi:acyl-CoA thioesterase FadM
VVNDKIAALGEQVGIFVDLQNKKPLRMPEGLKQKYQEFVA